MNEPFKCPRCGKESHEPMEVIRRYCGICHAFAEDVEFMQVQLVADKLALYRRLRVQGCEDDAMLMAVLAGDRDLRKLAVT